MYEFLNDSFFLDSLDNMKIKEQFVKFVLLDWNERPIKEIQGKVINGSLNLNGSSSLRRTANLSFFTEEKENDLSDIDLDLSINRKVKLEIGFVNNVPLSNYLGDNGLTISINFLELYGDIVWFPLGIYIIFDPNISHSTSGVTISVSLKDKMCLLNGDAGGVIPASTEFHVKEYDDENGETIKEYVILRLIIQECVNHWGQEDLSKIIIADLDDRIKQTMRWGGTLPLYYVSAIDYAEYFLDYDAAQAAAVNKQGSVQTLEYGDEAGFILTDFTYPGELIGDVGTTVTEVLDKIIAVLGNYEYFYDVFGNFRFLEIKNYLNTTYTTQAIKDNKIDVLNYNVDLSGGYAAYKFAGVKLISATSNAPKYSNIKNDFVVWGLHTSTDGSLIPIRYHLAIDKIPIPQEHKNIKWYEDEYGVTRAKKVKSGGTTFSCEDWREELYMQGIAAEDTGSDYPYYYTELVWELPRVWDFDKHTYQEEYKNNPSKISFFLDIIDSNSEVGKYSVLNIGRRSNVISDDKINCVFELTVPDVIILNNADVDENMRNECKAMGLIYTLVSEEIYDNLIIGGILNSCYLRVCEMLYLYTSMNNSITILAIPIYYLEPNIRINVQDPEAGIVGDFMILTISLPLTIDGVMSITASLAVQKI